MKIRNLKSVALCIGLSLTAAACSGSSGGPKANPPGPEKPEGLAKTKAPMALPEMVAGVTPSVDRKFMNDLMARAARENKAVVLDVAAAWCGPCMQFAYDMESHPEYYKKLSADGYILVKTETEKMAQISMNDFLPSFVKFFPSFYLYTPGQGWKMLGSANSYDYLATLLARAKTSGPLAPGEIKAAIELAGTAGQTPAGQAASARLSDSVFTISANYSYDEAKQVLAAVRADAKRFPSLQLEDLASTGESLSIVDYVAVGVLSVDELAKDFPKIAASMTDMSNQSFSLNQLTTYRMEYIARTAGPKAAAAQCESVTAGLRNRLKAGSLSQDDVKARLAQLERSSAITCAALELRANGPSEALKRKVATMDMTTLSDWEMVAALGETGTALEIYGNRYKEYADYYVKALVSLDEALQKAVEMGDTVKAEAIRKRIEILKFQQTHHAEVNTDVVDALRTGRALEILKVLN